MDKLPLMILDFGKVIIGKTYKKLYTPPKLIEIASITLSEQVNPLDIQFEVKLSLNKRKIEVAFTPERPGQHCCNYFIIVNTDKTVYNLNTRGETEDIKMELSSRVLTLAVQPGGRCKQYTKLINKSKTPGIFQFIVDNDCLSVEPKLGMVDPMEYLYITFTFKPDKVGVFYKEIYCLIQFHDPLLIKVKASCTTNIKNHEVDKQMLYMESVWQGKKPQEQLFKEETYNGAKYPGTFPVVISPKYLDLGSVVFGPGGGSNSSFAKFTVRCHTLVRIQVKWPEDPSGEFKISPKTAIFLEEGNIHEFQVTFIPNVPDKFSHVLLSPSILWGDVFSHVIPFFTDISLIGNSFDKRVCGWSPEYSIIPKSVKMPPTLPNFKVYSSITVKNYSHLPIMFKFIPKKNSPFDIYPMQGVINSKFQVFIIRMRPGNHILTALTDQWTLKLNTSYSAVIDLLGTVEMPDVNFLTSLNVAIPPTTLHCHSDSTLFIVNPTRLTLRYEVELKEFEKCLIKKGGSRTIHSNEFVHLNMTFCPRVLGEYRTSMFVNPYCLNPDGEIVKGRCLLTVTGLGVPPYLTVFPTKLLMEDIPLSCPTKASFVLKNKGFAVVHLRLTYRSKNPMFKRGNIVIEPNKLNLNNNEDRMISVKIPAQKAGYQEMEIVAVVLKCIDSTIPVDAINLMDVTYTVVNPSLKIIDLQLSNLHSTFSKYFSWMILNIDGINNTLSKLAFKKRSLKVICKAPEGEKRYKPISYKILFQNVGSFPCRLNVTELLTCDCPKKNRPKVCPHKEVNFKVSKELIQVNDTTTVTLNIHYKTNIYEKYFFRFDLGFEDKPNLCSFHMTVSRFVVEVDLLSGDVPLPYSNDIVNWHLCSVNLSERFSPLQTMWLYNNTRAETYYKLKQPEQDKKYIEVFNNEGTLKGKSLTPILILFSPSKLAEYKSVLEAVIGNRKFTINLLGKAILMDSHFFGQNIPTYSHFPTPTFPADISVDHIVIEKMATHSFKKQFVTVKNFSDKTVSFDWSRFIVGGVVSVSVEPQWGELFAGEIMSCLVCVRTYSYPVQITCFIHCKFTFPDETLAWLEQRRKFEQMSKEFENIFNISDEFHFLTDPGTPEIISEPEPHYLPLTISVDCRTSYECNTFLPSPTLSGRYFMPKEMGVSNGLISIASSILNRILWEILEDKEFYVHSEKHHEAYYEDFYENINTIHQRVHLPKRCITSFIDDTFYSIICEMFKLNPFLESDYNVLFPSNIHKTHTKSNFCTKANNLYFQDILAEANSKYSIYKPNNPGSPGKRKLRKREYRFSKSDLWLF